MANPRLIVEIAGDAKNLDKTLKGVETRTSKFGQKMQKVPLLGGLSKGGVAGLAGAAGAAIVVKGLSSVIAAAKESEISQANLDQAFKASGQSQKKYGKDVEARIQRISRISGLDDEALQNQFANLLRTTGNAKKALDGIGLAANIARARHISLAAAGKAVEKAYKGSDTALKRFGISLPAFTGFTFKLNNAISEQKDLLVKAKGAERDKILATIDDLKSQKKLAAGLDKHKSAQNAIAAAQKNFARAAVTYGKTAQGAQERLSVAFENLQERIGMKLLPVMTKLTLKALAFLDWSEKNWPRFAKAIQDAYNRAKPFIDRTIAVIRDIAKVIQGVIKIVRGISHGDWAQVWKGLKEVAVGQLKFIYDAFLSLPTKLAKALGAAAWNGVTRLFEAGVNRLITIANKVISGYNKTIGRIAGKITPIPSLGGAASAATTRPNTGLRGPVGVVGTPQSFTIQNRVILDGREIATNTTRHQQRARRANPTQKRGIVFV